MKVCILTLGCKVNQYESDALANSLEQLGYEVCFKLDEADFFIVNTCAVTNEAERKSRQTISKIKKVAPKAKIFVCGCASQHNANRFADLEGVNFVSGVANKLKLIQRIEKLSKKKIEVDELSTVYEDNLIAKKTKTRAYIKIQDGCNNFCTYCVVPYTRGVETSRPIEDVIQEAETLVAGGTLEINLLGQNVNSYHGEDANGKERNLAYLLNRLNEIDGLKRIRYTTSYPADVNDELIDCHKNLPKLMPYLHLPIQSGSDAILKAMNRRHNSSQYLDIIARLREANPNLGFSSDFIVGFPGETDADFQATLDVVDKVKYIQAFSFKYSRRPGTPASVMPNQVEEKIKKERLTILQNKLFDYQTKFNQATVGKIVPVLFETKGRHSGQLVGRTPYMQNLHAEVSKDYLNKIVDIKVESATMNSLSGTVVKV